MARRCLAFCANYAQSNNMCLLAPRPCRLRIWSKGRDSLETATSHMNLADLYLSRLDLDEAQMHAERALKIQKAHW